MATYLLATDWQRSVLQDLHAYSPYGFSRATSELTLGFCGQHRDPFTGNYPLGNGRRFYSPTLMRFMTCDSLSPFARGGINGYAYCGGDPVNRHDPSGEAFWALLLRTVGVASSGATLTGAFVRTLRNVVGRWAQFRQFPFGTNTTPTPHQELAPLARAANLQFGITGTSGVAAQLTAAVSGVTPGVQSLADVFAIGNSVTNLTGGLTGVYTAGHESIGYLRAYPRDIPRVVLETVMDLTMVAESLSAVGRGFMAVGERIRSTRPTPHNVHA